MLENRPQCICPFCLTIAPQWTSKSEWNPIGLLWSHLTQMETQFTPHSLPHLIPSILAFFLVFLLSHPSVFFPPLDLAPRCSWASSSQHTILRSSFRSDLRDTLPVNSVNSVLTAGHKAKEREGVGFSKAQALGGPSKMSKPQQILISICPLHVCLSVPGDAF